MNRKLMIVATVLFLGFASCKKDETESQQEAKELVNPNPAENNSDIVSQHFSDRVQVFSKTKVFNNDIYTFGTISEKTNIMKINSLGDVIWAQNISSLNILQQFAVNEKAVFVVGNYQQNEKEENTRSKLQAYSHSGQYLTDYTFVKNDYEQTILYNLAISGNDVIAVGYVQKAENQYPFLVVLSFENNQFVLKRETIFTQFPKQRIINIATANNNLYFTTNEYTQVSDEIRKVNFVKVTEADHAVVWTLPIEPENPQYQIWFRTFSTIIINNNNIYAVGNTDDEKTPAPSSGGYWGSGFVVNVVDNGANASLAWKKKITASNKSDRLHDITLHNNNLYAVGEHSALFYSNDKKYFSNGFITKLDTNGNVLYTKAFGEKEKESKFWAVTVIGGQLVSLGRVNDPLRSNYKAWIVKTAL